MSKRGRTPISAAEAAKRFASSLENGGASRDRTDDLKLAKLALSQLSYGPTAVRIFTDLRTDEQAIRHRWWAEKELNLRPHAYQACALTT